MARPPATKEGEKTAAFTVSEGVTMSDMDGVRRKEGDSIQLTKDQARYFQKLGNVVHVDTDALFDEEDEDEETDGSTDTGAGDGSTEEPAQKAFSL